ncbi:MAG: DUF4190 domain-containing protein [Planctomycetes bacterium]|nr:DUF4190 domain-containing protein [Planctomycetota bacterium]
MAHADVTRPPAPSSAADLAPPPAAPRTSGLAVASLVCGLAGVCTCGLGGLIGLVLGLVGLRRIRRSGGRLTGRGLAVGGVVVSVLGLALGALVLVLASVGTMRWVEGWIARARENAYLNNGRSLATAIIWFDMESGRLPPPDGWIDALRSRGGLAGDAVLTNPSDVAAGRAFAMNARLEGASVGTLARPGRVVLVFECAPGGPLAGDRRDLPPAPRYPRGYAVAFCDGHGEWVPPERVGSLVWDPDPAPESTPETLPGSPPDDGEQ